MRHNSSLAIVLCFLLTFLLFPVKSVNAQEAGGAPCSAADGSYTGPTDYCISGFCRRAVCSDAVNIVPVGSPCLWDYYCMGGEANEFPPYCGAPPGEERLCGGASTFCFASDGSGTGPSPVCASGRCRDYRCTALNPSPPGGPCRENWSCEVNGVCVDGTCNAPVCLASDGSLTGITSDCESGFCRLGQCASSPTRQIGQTCASSDFCVGAESENETPPGCSGPPGTIAACGGATAYCVADQYAEAYGPSSICASGQCSNNRCTKGSPLGVGLPCNEHADCLHGIFCNYDGLCRGGERQCDPNNGNPTRNGPSRDCFSGFCREGQCSNLPTARLGDECLDSRDCAGSDAEGRLLNCGEEKFGVRRCGGAGALCSTAEGGVGSAPELCISGQCSNFACVDVAPSPGLGKRVGVQKHLTERVCPAGFEPCPISSKGYECIDFMNDIESCGGCVGDGMPGVDCSADVHASEISCVDGKCVIACERGYAISATNNTCVAE